MLTIVCVCVCNHTQAPPADGSSLDVKVDKASNRLQLLDPFKPWNGDDIKDAAILIKVCVCLSVRVCCVCVCESHRSCAPAAYVHLHAVCSALLDLSLVRAFTLYVQAHATLEVDTCCMPHLGCY